MNDIVKRIRQQSYFGLEPYEAADEIEQLRQRVAELETQLAKNNPLLDEAADALDKLTAERDKATQYWNIAEGRCDALKQQRDELVEHLENILFWDNGKPEFDDARAAIASVKEKA